MPTRAHGNKGWGAIWLAAGIVITLLAFPMAQPAHAQTAAADTLSEVLVVPNPWVQSGRTWGPPSEVRTFERIRFHNLPMSPCSIYILTAQGNQVIELKHQGDSRYFLWDGRNESNQYIVSGLYLYVVDSPTLGQRLGKLVVIR